MATSDFVTQFYNLEGDLVSERKKNFFKLLKAQPSLNEDDLKSFCPRTHLERLFQIDIFIHFKMSTKLLEVIKEGNEIFISKILKHPPLLLEIIGNISPKAFVNDFLPTTSYALRMKILKRISFVLSESQMDEMVSSVHKRYGLNIATKLIHTCSSKKIKDFLSNHEVILKPRQVKFIFDKDTELFLFYINYYKTLPEKSEYSHRNVCQYVALKDPNMWYQLHKEHSISQINLGRRTSKNFLRHTSDDFRSNIEHYSDFLKLDVIVRKLHGNFKEVYFELFPRNTYNISTYNFSYRLLRHYPKDKQWDMFTQTYLKVFGNNILDNLIYLNSSFIKLFPNKTIMNKWAETHYEKHKSNRLLKYCHPNTAIPLIKEKINVTSNIYERKILIILLLENCQRNEDFTSLGGVLKYICFRHRNEENTSEILNKIKDLFKLEELDENHWNHINEMLTILKLRKQSYYYTVTFYLKYIEYLILHGKPYRKELILYIKEFESSRYTYYVDLENKKVKRQILIEIVNIYREVEEIDDIEFKKKFIRILIEFNERNTEYIIDLSDFSGFLPYIKSILDSDYTMLKDDERNLLIKVINYNFKFPEKPTIVIEETRLLEIFQQDSKKSFNFGHIIEKIIKKLDRSEFEDSIVKLFWDNLEKFKYFDFCRKIIHWLFLNNPKAITPYFDLIWMANQTYIKIKEIKFMSHLGFDKKVVAYCADKLTWLDDFLKDIFEKQSPSSTKMETDSEPQKEIDLDMYKKVIEYLSILLTTDEYIEIILKRFLPVKEKINLADEALNQMYYLQCEVAGSLKKLHEPAIVLPTVMKFCVGDYLQSALPSLYSVCYRAPEELLYSYMDVLSKRAVSVKKHALFLSCEVLNYDYALSKLRNFDEIYVSSQKHMFSATLKYFRKNPCEELLTLVALNLNTIDKNDDETLTSLVNIVVPKKYKTVYIQKCWNFFENLRKEDIKVQQYLQLFLDAILASEDTFLSLTFDFYKHVITHYFKNPPKNDHNLNGINRFVCSVLRNVRLEEADNFKFIFDIIPSFPTHAIKSFFDNFYDLATDDVKNNNKIDTANNYYIELFKQHWFNTFTPIKMFNEHVLLDLLYLKCKSSDSIVENYAKEALIYLEELIAEYGLYIYYKFKDLVLHKHTFTKREIYLFLYNILTIKNSTINYILVIDIIKDQSCSDEVDDIHRKIMKILRNSDQRVVSVYFNSYFG